MKTFKDNKYISGLNEFSMTLKRYNKVLAAMNTFENYYLSQWKSEIEDAKAGLKSYLIVKDEANLTFRINSDERLITVFEEVKWLFRLHIDLPPSARDLLSQEKKFKLYKSNLDTLLKDYEKCIEQIPEHMYDLFKVHIKQTLDLCDPGCAILTWNSLNIGNFFLNLFCKD